MDLSNAVYDIFSKYGYPDEAVNIIVDVMRTIDLEEHGFGHPDIIRALFEASEYMTNFGLELNCSEDISSI